jgi:protein-S-isoprenylcysteine O-methyltransferase Ste14
MTHLTRFKPPVLLLLTLAAMPLAHGVLPLAKVLPPRGSLIGVLPVAAGIALNIIADRLFKVHGSVSACRGPDALVTEGPHALSRNPMYLGFALILFGTAVVLGSLAPLLLAIAFIPLTERLFIRYEEAALSELHGTAWSSYATRVRRWI